jgi:hypothetical protein
MNCSADRTTVFSTRLFPDRPVLPQSFYRLIPELYPVFFEICKQCDISGPEFFILSYVKHFGRGKGQEILVSDLDVQLAGVGMRKKSTASDFRNDLLERGLITIRRTTPKERNDLYPTDQARGKQALFVDLTPKAEETLRRFNEKAEETARAIAPSSTIFRLAWLAAAQATLTSMTARARDHATTLRKLRTIAD